MSVSLDYLMVEDAPSAAIITLNRPEQLNALSTGLMKELTAERWGLINRAVPREQLDKEVMTLVTELAQLSRSTLQIGKESFYKQIEATQAQAYEMMAEVISCNAVANDGQEGIAAFVEKRKPVWRS